MARRKEGARAWVGVSDRTKERRRKDQHWEVAYEDPNDGFKRRRKGGFRSKDEAEDWRVAFLSEAKAGNWRDPACGDRLFKDVAEEWFKAQVFNKANTERTQRRIVTGKKSLLGMRFNGVRIGDIRHSDVREWVKSLGVEGKAASTVRNHFYVLRLVMRYAVVEGLVQNDPTIGIKLPWGQRANESEADRYPLTAKEVEAICTKVPDPWKTYVRLAFATGMRPAEIAGLQVRDYDSTAMTLRVRQVWSGGRYEPPKTALSRRAIRLDTKTALLVEEHLRNHQRRAQEWFALNPEREWPGDRLPLFVGVGEFKRGCRERKGRKVDSDLEWLDYSRPVKHGWFYMRYWKQALETVGLPSHIRFYDLRHAHASLLAARIGQPGALTLKECQERLGHSNMSTFYDRYVHSAKDVENRQRDALDALYDEPEGNGVTPIRKRA